ncbi:MAG TPA: hypothetical protein VG326_15945 [Tepidisphaeraceae bacterium]|jgi:pimeloyl-ACP methyl ester carboxylesterase|nr:hypothetical protein [Tepidisphaeraceae bacterium]
MRKLFVVGILGLFTCHFGLSIDGVIAASPAPAVAVERTVAVSDTWLLHLPGIAGRRWVDDQMMLGFKDAGVAGVCDVYDWTGEDPGIAALHAYKRNQEQAQIVADLIADHFHRHPDLHILLSGHSGGTGIAVWALEKLPADVKIDKLLLMASALSPGYDLSKALAHVRNKCYSFCSENDVMVLDIGTRMFGTIDGKKTEAAGAFGFLFPAGADSRQYDKLIQKPYDKVWLRYRNFGDHMGCMLRPFARDIVAPLMLDHPALSALEKATHAAGQSQAANSVHAPRS